MLKDVLISMQSVHGYDTDEADTIDFSTDGHYTFTDGVGCITYLESEITGMEGTRTSVFVMPDKVVIDRDGTVTSRMVFGEGLSSSMLYDTPYGSAKLGIKTRRMEKRFDENGGDLTIDYIIDMEHAVFARSKLTINVKEQTGGQFNA